MYNEKLFQEIEQLKKENEELKIEIKLIQSDNLILKSKLSYSEASLSQRSS